MKTKMNKLKKQFSKYQNWCKNNHNDTIRKLKEKVEIYQTQITDLKNDVEQTRQLRFAQVQISIFL